MDVSKTSGFSPQIIHLNRVFHCKPSILGYPYYFWKHGNTYIYIYILYILHAMNQNITAVGTSIIPCIHSMVKGHSTNHRISCFPKVQAVGPGAAVGNGQVFRKDHGTMRDLKWEWCIYIPTLGGWFRK